MKTKHIEKIKLILRSAFSVLIACLIILLVFFLIYYAINPNKTNILEFIMATSTFMIALLTLAYVMTTSRQLTAMRQQLQEMKKSRELISQPLPIPIPSKVFIEKPRAYYSPPDKKYNGISRYHVECEVNNHGTSPAVSIHLCSCLNVNINGKTKSFRSSLEYIDVSPEKSHMAAADKNAPSFMFVEDESAIVIDALRSQDPRNAPLLRICTVYKNVLGASFVCRQSFQLFRETNEQEEILKKWQSQITTFSSTFKHEIEELKRLADKDSKGWDSLFKEMKETYTKMLEGEDQNIRAIQAPGAFKTETITEEQYKTFTQSGLHGQFMLMPTHCLVDEG
jgi:hypothetical protein